MKATDFWVYFKAGHSGYLGYFLGLLNATILQYTFIVSRIPAAESLFGGLAAYLGLYFVFYFPFAALVGWIDYRRGTIRKKGEIDAHHNPYTQDLTRSGVYYNRAFMAFFRGDREQALWEMERSTELIEKWVK